MKKMRKKSKKIDISLGEGIAIVSVIITLLTIYVGVLKDIGDVKSQINGINAYIQNDLANKNARMQRLEDRFDSAVPLKVIAITQ